MNKLIFSLFFFCFSFPLFAREVPELTSPVIDEAKVISYGLKKKIESSLLQLQRDQGYQLQVLLLKSLGDNETIEGFSIKATDKWKLGSKSDDNGILILVSVGDRKMRIEVGDGLEGQLTDLQSGRIIQLARPYFKQGEYGLGLIVILNSIADTLGVKLKQVPIRKRRRRKTSHSFIFILILFILTSVFGRGRRSSGIGWLLLGSALGGGRSSGGFGGGGSSWSGGGGGFSGGGASGDW